MRHAILEGNLLGPHRKLMTSCMYVWYVAAIAGHRDFWSASIGTVYY